MNNLLVNFFNKYKIGFKAKTFVLAVSTGVDSMVLLSAFLKLKEEYDFKLQVAHFNHGQRAQSETEEAFIKAFCFEKEIGCYCGNLKKQKSGNFQNYAREQRYNFFQKIVFEVKADYLVLAHHANDNMETILMRIIRGSNLKGYSGMEAVTPFQGISLIRPFLEVRKDDLIKYAELHKIKYYQDLSNFDDVYTRNRIRKDIIPLLFKEEENVHLKFQEFSDTLKAANLLLEERVHSFTSKIAEKEDHFSFSIEDFLSLSDFLQVEVLFSCLKKYLLSKKNIEELIKLIKSDKKNLKVYFLKKFTFVKEYGVISFYKDKINFPAFDILIEQPGRYEINDKIVVNVIKKTSVDVSNLNDLWYNIDMLPIRLRSRKTGDKILLDAGYKKVKDLLIDKKIGILDREQVIICEKDEIILAVLGVRKSSILKQIKNNDIVIKVEQKDG
ncbi:MAG: tRNA lysidine(34) synthetase TilS [Bacilli bacterium]|nr:tRNA lysidine(34) synthetase TilS [Bacilli bacterium]